MVRGTAQNPDVFFQAREACNPFYAAVPDVVQAVFDELASAHRAQLLAGRVPRRSRRRAGDRGDGLGSGRHDGGSRRARRRRRAGRRGDGAPVSPVPGRGAWLAALPSTCRSIAVLDRTKEPGSVGEPLYLDVRCAIDEAMDADAPPFAVATPGDRRPLRPVVQGVHAGDGQGRVRRAGTSIGPEAAASPSGSTTTSPT